MDFNYDCKVTYINYLFCVFFISFREKFYLSSRFSQSNRDGSGLLSNHHIGLRLIFGPRRVEIIFLKIESCFMYTTSSNFQKKTQSSVYSQENLFQQKLAKEISFTNKYYLLFTDKKIFIKLNK